MPAPFSRTPSCQLQPQRRQELLAQRLQLGVEGEQRRELTFAFDAERGEVVCGRWFWKRSLTRRDGLELLEQLQLGVEAGPVVGERRREVSSHGAALRGWSRSVRGGDGGPVNHAAEVGGWLATAAQASRSGVSSLTLSSSPCGSRCRLAS